MTPRPDAAELRPNASPPDAGPSPADLEADALFAAAARRAESHRLRRPRATYRLQLHRGFRLVDVEAILDYLDDLGVSDAYFSPYLAARPGSTHGYDVFNHGEINPEIGDDEAHERLVSRMIGLGMGRVVDVVPNHMGITGGNPYWFDLLENGEQAESARYFDVDWEPVKEELEGRVLLPILGDQYGKVLEDGQLVVGREGGAFHLDYWEHRLPIAPRSYALILRQRPDELAALLPPDDVHLLEFRSVISAIENLPPRDATDDESVARYRAEKEVIKHRLARLCEERPELSGFIDENLTLFRGTPGDPRSFDLLHELLEMQVYRLAYWRVAVEEINYRRFFDINDLAGIRTEDPEVFETTHRLIFDWVDRGGVSALRIDHPDGLADPAGYFSRLQETLFVRSCLRELDPDTDPAHRDAIEARLRDRFRSAVAAEPDGPLARRFPVVIEKILSRGEDLPERWMVDGTVGYEYLNTINGLFVDPDGQPTIDASYVEFTGDREPWAEVVYDAKQVICRASLASELNMLARQLNRVSEHDRRSRDFTLNDLRRALREVIACFPVYRTYLRPGEPISERDRAYIDMAVHRARRRNPTIDPSVFEFVRAALLLEHPEGISDDEIRQREAFVTRFQQTTGPVTAKGVEDTAFYRQIKLASLNEVGGEPGRFGHSPSSFHAMNAHRLSRWPGGFSTTATHDNKRGEDARMRINVLSELADDWQTHLNRWGYWNKTKKVDVQGSPAPDPREEYLFYQTLVGIWPFGNGDDVPEGLVGRVQQYMLKAIREAKVNTTWTDPDPSYSDAVSGFIADVITGEGSDIFLKDFLPFARRVARIGVIGSIGQALLKVASPGVPDIYQGCELWDLALVDPDNRRPVDYDLRRRILSSLRDALASGTPRAELASRLLASPDDGAIKLYAIWTALQHRKAHPDLYAQGVYRPLEAEGERKAHVVSFGRYRDGRYAAVVVPRLAASLMGDDGTCLPVGPDVWQDTHLTLPDSGLPRRWRNLLTDEVVTLRDGDDRPTLPLAEIFRTIPFGLMVEDS
ncbi:malto-oligosyltrehalose synthase [Tautonia sociabilis]|uniref:Malto-oligosyltrehalose synthase n=1 Tax=Tautonia sociabilis TaxID=2080755 RepID=A0A432MI60_9BACT|nr:malto-oligosyltrehalose synthase [Tautonia sociabilis]RUL86864.1 malto-oligosyltrehalose synthase [Tautonia sociabilis]